MPTHNATTSPEESLIHNSWEVCFNKVEEAGVSFDDPGIINDNGVIVVTRDFKLKSPRKYSFKDFGVLAEPPVR